MSPMEKRIRKKAKAKALISYPKGSSLDWSEKQSAFIEGFVTASINLTNEIDDQTFEMASWLDEFSNIAVRLEGLQREFVDTLQALTQIKDFK